MATKISAVREGKNLRITAQSDAKMLELRLSSDSNQNIFRASGVSTFAPAGWKSTNPRFVFPGGGRELYFMTVDICPTEKLEAVAEIENLDGGTYRWNSPLIDRSGELDKEKLVFPAEEIQYWENNLLLKDSLATVTFFYLRCPVTFLEGVWQGHFELLTESFSGYVSLHEDNGTLLAQARVEGENVQLAPLEVQPEALSQDTLKESLHRVLKYLLRSRDMRPGSRTEGGFAFLYDHDWGCYRAPHWMWAWGPVIRLMLEAEKLDMNDPAPKVLREAAQLCGQTSLHFLVNDPHHPAADICRVRWETTIHGNNGYCEYISPTDSLFLSGWGWIPLYEATGDARYLAAARKLAEATGRISDEYGIVPQDFEVEQNAWSPHLYDESSFGMDGFSELYRVTGEQKYADMGLKFMEQLLERFDRGDGFWHRIIYREGGLGPWELDSKGEAWVYDGLVAAYRMTGSEAYLERVTRMVGRMLELQREDGHWDFYLDNRAENFVNEKATPIWSYYLYELYRLTEREEYLVAARKALAWSIRNQYTGPDPLAVGSLNILTSSMCWEYHHLSYIYAVNFLGLAILEELKLQADK